MPTEGPPSLQGALERAETRSATGPVLLVCSSGGHLLQLTQLKDQWSRDDRVWVTFDRMDAQSLLRDEDVHHAYHPTNRNLKNLVRNLGLAWRLLRRIRPRAVVTTGAGVAVPFCILGRFLGAQVVYIESFARITEPSLTGRLVAPFAHQFFVQWPDLLPHYRRAEYRGNLFDLS